MSTNILLRPKLKNSLEFLDYIRSRAAAQMPKGVRKVLDVGTGKGILLSHLKGEHRVVSLDSIPRTSHRDHMSASIAEMPIDSDSFDGLFCVNVITCLDPLTLQKGLWEMTRVVRPGGWIVITAPNGNHPLTRMRFLLRSRKRGLERRWAFSPSWIEKQFRTREATVQQWEWILPASFSKNPIRKALAGTYASLVSKFPHLAPYWIALIRRNKPSSG